MTEPAADLALLLAIAGAHQRKSVASRTAAVGEIGLGGEIRHPTNLEQRAREAHRLGCKDLIAPADEIPGSVPIRLHPAHTVQDALDLLERMPMVRVTARGGAKAKN